MTLVFILSFVVIVAIVGSLLIVLVEYGYRHEKAEKLQRRRENSVTESIADSEAAFDFKRAA